MPLGVVVQHARRIGLELIYNVGQQRTDRVNIFRIGQLFPREVASWLRNRDFYRRNKIKELGKRGGFDQLVRVDAVFE